MLKQLCEIPAPASGEEAVKKFLINELSGFTDSYYTDNFGNLVFEKHGKGDIVVIECGIDEPFLMVTDGEEDKIRFSAPPHFKAKFFSDKLISSSDGISLKVMSENDDEKMKFSDLYAQKNGVSAECGTLFTILPQYFETDYSFVSKNLINKVPAYVLSKAIKEIKDCDKNLYFLFSVNKCLADRGLKAFLSDHEAASVLSVGCIKESDYLIPGEGAIICAKEKSCVPTVKMRKKLCEIAEKNEVEFSVKVMSENLNLKSVLTTASGAECGFIGICFKENQINEYEILKNDIKNVTKLLISYCKE